MDVDMDRLKAEVAAQGIALTDDDLAAIGEILAASRAGLARARPLLGDEPDVLCGFIPPGLLPEGAPPHDDG